MCRNSLTQCYNFRISNEELLRRLNLRTIDDYVTKKQLRWDGHVDRMALIDYLEKCCLRGYVLNTLSVYLNMLWLWFVQVVEENW